MHVLRSVSPNGNQKHMNLACLTPNPKWVICLSPAKNKIYRYFTYVSVILRSWCTLQYAILPIFVWRFHSNPPRPLVRTPSCILMHPKWSGTQNTSKNSEISTLDPHNFFLAAYFYTKFDENSYIYVYNALPEFAPFLSSLKKFQFVKNPLYCRHIIPGVLYSVILRYPVLLSLYVVFICEEFRTSFQCYPLSHNVGGTGTDIYYRLHAS